jgi:HlyD family secretion protein
MTFSNEINDFCPGWATGILIAHSTSDARKTHMIRDASTMDQPIDTRPQRRRQLLALAVVIAVLVVLGLVFMPSIRRWARSETSVPRSQIRLGTAVRGDLVREVAVDGRVIAAFHPTAFSPAQGIVTIATNAGEVVEKGHILAKVESPELESSLDQERATLAATTSDHNRLEVSSRQQQLENRQDVDLADVRVAAAGRAFERAQRLFDLGLVNEIDLETARDEVTVRSLELAQAEKREELEVEMLALEIEDSGQQLERQRLLVVDLQRRVDALTVRAPVAGLVSRLHVEDREAVARNTALVTVVDLSALEVEIAVAENLADEVIPGTTAVITVGIDQFAGTVVGISPEVEGSRVKGRVAFAGEIPAGLKQNQRVNVRAVLESRSDVLKVPRGPFLEAGSGRHAYVVADGMAEQRPIEVGATSVSEVEIVSGLEVGDEIIISDTTRFESAQRVLVR